jgi:hypothetical protein
LRLLFLKSLEVTPGFTPSSGIVKLTGVWQTGQHENPKAQLSTSPFSL